MQKSTLISQCLHFLLLCMLLVLIWKLGPEISIAGIMPLQSPLHRTIVNTILILIWLFYTTAKPRLKIPLLLSTQNAQTRTMLTLLTQRFHGAIHFLKRTTINSKKDSTQSLYHLPWYLIIGPPKSGKTSLLAKSGLSFVLSKQDQAGPTELCDWWVSRDAVFLDTTGNFCPLGKRQTHYKILWLHLLQLIKQQKLQHLNGVLLTLDLPKLAKLPRSKKMLLYHNIRANLALIKKQLSSDIPIYLVCNQCDRIWGFQEFFSDLGKEEQQQIWGTTLFKSHRLRQRLLLTYVKKELNTLINRLHERLLWRLHHERDQQKRLLIKDFPVQIEMLSQHIISAVKQLNHGTRTLWLRGIYFTSSTQSGFTQDYVLSTMQKNLNFPKVSQNYFRNNTNYQPDALFAKQLFQQLLPQEKLLVKTVDKQIITVLWRHTAVICAAVIIVTCGALWSQQWINHMNYTSRIEKVLVQYQTLANIALISAPTETQSSEPIVLDDNHNRDRLRLVLAALNAAQLATNSAQYQPKSNQLTYWLKPQKNAIEKQLQKLYQLALSQLLTPEITRLSHEQLLNTIDTLSPDFYSNLEVYLMLGDPTHLNRTFVQAWLTAYWERLFANDVTAQQQLVQHTLHWLTNTLPATPLDDELLAAVRQKMQAQIET